MVSFRFDATEPPSSKPRHDSKEKRGPQVDPLLSNLRESVRRMSDIAAVRNLVIGPLHEDIYREAEHVADVVRPASLTWDIRRQAELLRDSWGIADLSRILAPGVVGIPKIDEQPVQGRRPFRPPAHMPEIYIPLPQPDEYDDGPYWEEEGEDEDDDKGEPGDELTDKLSIEQANEARVIVREGRTTVEVRGQRRVSLFLSVVAGKGDVVRWGDLLKADLQDAGEELDRRLKQSKKWRPPTPRCATSVTSLQRAGRRVRDDLGKLAYHWHQDGRGARWDAEVE